MSFKLDALPEIPSFHDGSVSGLLVEKGWARVFLRRVGGRTYELILSGLEALRADDFREGNIVQSLEIVSGCAPDDPRMTRALAMLFPAPHPAAEPQYRQRYDLFVSRQVSALSAGAKSLVLIEPSYGCELAALCREVELRETSNPPD